MSSARLIAFACLAVSATLPALGAPPTRLKTLYSFKGAADGANPDAGLTFNGGAFYGTTVDGGASGYGTVFKLNPTTGVESVICSFTGVNGDAYPYCAPIFRGPALYGTTGGGDGAGGTVFTLNPKSGAETVLYAFQPEPDGSRPLAGLATHNGLAYGTTSQGGTTGNGSVFSIDPKTGIEKVIYSFRGGSDGQSPVDGLLYRQGVLYGTTAYGGSPGYGVVFAVDSTTGAETVLHTFQGNGDGVMPVAGLISVGDTLYGTTIYGGANFAGAIFAVDLKAGSESLLYSFKAGTDGISPAAGVTFHAGALYGTTNQGGALGQGTVFKVSLKTATETVLYSFNGTSDGANPQATLTYDEGKLYGITVGGGAYGYGTVFRLTP
jgi:uncharacterized repeat protein (TIGR03803 family)